MSEQEVLNVLGVSPGDYGPGKGELLEPVTFTMTSYQIRTDPNAKRWLAGEFAITVCFDDNGGVTGLGTDRVYRPYDTIPEMLLQKAGLKPKKPYPAGTLNALFNGR